MPHRPVNETCRNCCHNPALEGSDFCETCERIAATQYPQLDAATAAAQAVAEQMVRVTVMRYRQDRVLAAIRNFTRSAV